MQPIEAQSTRDPAPTRLSYRLQRLWLTPFFRFFMRFGLPVLLIAGVIGGYLASADRRDNLRAFAYDMRRLVEERPEFMVRLMAIDGASRELDEDIREIVPLDFPVSSFDLDLNNIRETIGGLDAVAEVSVQVKPGGILSVAITERTPAVIWRSRQGLELLDDEGHRVAPIADRTLRPDLPLIAGDGADMAVAEAMMLFKAASPINTRLRGLSRIGERRWDVVLDRKQTIMLPEEGAINALNRVMALDRAHDLLERDIVAVDMRNAARPTIRLSERAMEQLRTIRTIEAGARSR